MRLEFIGAELEVNRVDSADVFLLNEGIAEANSHFYCRVPLDVEVFDQVIPTVLCSNVPCSLSFSLLHHIPVGGCTKTCFFL